MKRLGRIGVRTVILRGARTFSPGMGVEMKSVVLWVSVLVVLAGCSKVGPESKVVQSAAPAAPTEPQIMPAPDLVAMAKANGPEVAMLEGYQVLLNDLDVLNLGSFGKNRMAFVMDPTHRHDGFMHRDLKKDHKNFNRANSSVEL